MWSWDDGLFTPALDLSFGSWAFGQASFLMTNGDCFWTWMLGDGTCHFSIKLVILELGLRRSFILNKKLYLFSDLELGRWTCHSRFLSEHQQNSRLKRCFRLLALPQSPDLLVETQIMRCICEPEPNEPNNKLWFCWTCVTDHWTCHPNIGLVILKLIPWKLHS